MERTGVVDDGGGDLLAELGEDPFGEHDVPHAAAQPEREGVRRRLHPAPRHLLQQRAYPLCAQVPVVDMAKTAAVPPKH